ncbi:MAG: efflux RND transporter permease subunit [Pseudomonadales bacterium]
MNPISWMTRHGIAPNLLMLVLIIGGLVMSVVIRKEYLPETTLDIVQVVVQYPGASPDELESAVAVPIESALDGLDGVRSVKTKITTGRAKISVELAAGGKGQKIYQDIQQAVDRITSFPQGIEKPYIGLANRVIDVMEIAVHADLDRLAVKRLAEQLQDRLLQSPDITQVVLRGLPKEELHVEISSATLQRYNLDLDGVAQRLKKSAVEQSAGSIKSSQGDILVKVDERRNWADEFATIPIVSSGEGDRLQLADIATVSDGFADDRELITFDGQPAVTLRIYRTGNQTPKDIANAVTDMWPDLENILPPAAGMTVVDDDAKNYSKRLGLLLKNAFYGLLLVLVLMSLFLEHRLAFWVVAGIPSAFLGAILFLPLFDVSINMVSMFGFIIAIGIVVDDAIIAGENIYSHMQDGQPFEQAALLGAREVAMPLTIAILTNIVAFLPLLLLTGYMKLLFGAIPIVVVLCFIVSWVEALFILPSHLARLKEEPGTRFGKWMDRVQGRFDRRFQAFIHNTYRPLLRRSLAWPELTAVLALCVFMLVISYAYSGKMGFSLMPKMEGRWVKASIELPEDVPLAKVLSIRDRVEASAREVQLENKLDNEIVSIRSEIFETNLEVALLLAPSEEREISTAEVKELWREKTQTFRELGKFRFSSARRGSSALADASITLEFRHADPEVLAEAIAEAQSFASRIDGVVGAVSTMTNGKPQWKLKLNENGRSLGLDAADLSKQLRTALYGARALRQHRGKNQVTVLVRLPLSERQAISDVENMLIRTGNGGYSPLYEVAEIETTFSASRIIRLDGDRIESLGVEVLPEEAVPAVGALLSEHLVPDLLAKYPALKVGYGGQQRQIKESISSLQIGAAFALGAIYCLLAIAFHSYSQPLLIMAVIPFGAVGAIVGHMVLGFGLSVVSLMGMLALAGVVVNDSLILVEYANKRRQAGDRIEEAILKAGVRRFRPIILTTLTTFGGLAPMVFETSRQAQFIVPMAVSLGFGILITTVVCLLVLPSLYLMLERRLHPEPRYTSTQVKA